MKIAVTGATGFIGRHVLQELAHRRAETIAVARRSSQPLPPLPCTRIVRLDILGDPASSYEALGEPEVLIHLAWGGLSNYRSLHHFERELPAHYQFLKAVLSSGVKTLLVAGTCFEYGMQSGPLREDMEARPNNPYGFAKDNLRRQLEYLKATQPFNLIWSRLFYVYGEGQGGNSLFPQIKQAAERGDRVFNMSRGEQLRDYLPVTDSARCIVSLALKQADVGVVNVCSGDPISVRRLVEGWVRENGWSIALNLGHYPYPDHEPMAFWGSAEKLRAAIGSPSD